MANIRPADSTELSNLMRSLHVSNARMAGLDEAEQEAAAQAAFDRVAGPEAGW